MKETIPVRITRKRYNELKALADKNSTTLTFMLELACSKFIKNSEGLGYLITEIEDSYDRAIDNFATGKVPGKVVTPAKTDEVDDIVDQLSAIVAPTPSPVPKKTESFAFFDGEVEL